MDKRVLSTMMLSLLWMMWIAGGGWAQAGDELLVDGHRIPPGVYKTVDKVRYLPLDPSATAYLGLRMNRTQEIVSIERVPPSRPLYLAEEEGTGGSFLPDDRLLMIGGNRMGRHLLMRAGDTLYLPLTEDVTRALSWDHAEGVLATGWRSRPTVWLEELKSWFEGKAASLSPELGVSAPGQREVQTESLVYRVFENGDYVIGTHEQGVLEGVGLYHWGRDGTRYVGGFHDGEIHGLGRYTYAGGGRSPVMVSKEGLSPFPSRKYTETRRSYRAEQSVLLVAVSFEDVRVQTPEEELAKRLLEVSAAWHELSGGQHRLVPARENYGRSNDGVVSIQLDRTHGGGGEGEDFMEEILVPLAKEWDADAYDLNGDGILDPDELHVILLVAGRESESPVEEPSVLSHRIRLSSDRTRLTPWVDLPGYMVIGEIWEDGNLTPTGVFLHELGHSFGLPDLYGPPSPRGIGEESLMARGYRTEAGGVAPLDPFSRIQLGLIEAVESSPPLHLRPGEGSVLKVPSEGARYVLVETLERGVRFWVVDEGKINGRYEENRLNADPMDPALRLFRGHKGATFDLKAPFLVGFEGMRFRSSGDGKLQILK